MNEKQLRLLIEKLEKDIAKKEQFKQQCESSLISEEVKNSKISIVEDEISLIKTRLNELYEELRLIEYNKPENVIVREIEEQERIYDEAIEDIRKSREDNERKFYYLDMLIEYLNIAGFNDLANELNYMRYAFKNSKDSYIEKEIDIRQAEKYYETKTLVTKKECRNIKKSVIRLTKDASRKAKKYKELYDLFLHSKVIIKDIEDKGISKDNVEQVVNYFNKPTGNYCARIVRDYELIGNCENLGYTYLEFYRNNIYDLNKEERKR